MKVKKFKSRKNSVELVRLGDLTLVRKQFSCLAGYEKERAIYELLQGKGLAVPRLACGSEEGVLLFEYLDAPTLCELLEQAEEGHCSEELLIEAYLLLFEWLQEFHSLTGQCMRDMNARNFLFDGKTLYGLDFESVDDGIVEDDIGRALAFLMTYHPEGSSLKRAVQQRLERFIADSKSLKDVAVEAAYHAERRAMRERR